MKRRVMFLCSGNSARSQMAEGLLRHVAGDRFDVVSAGTEPTVVNEVAVRAMSEIGIDISTQRSKSVTEFLGEHFTHLITVCDNARERCPIFPGAVNRLHWPMEDPAGVTVPESERLATFRRIRDQLRQKIAAFATETRTE